MRSIAAFAVVSLLDATVARGTPPPRWIPVPESETPGGTLCVPRLFGPTGPCFSKPGADWQWMQTEGGWHYLCRRDQSWYGFSIHAYSDRTLSREAVAEEVRRTSFNPTGRAVRDLKVEASVLPVTGSFKYTYVLRAKKEADAISVGYVTPSGWVVAGLFETPNEPAEFRQFLLSYRMPQAVPK
jgi:hypothetical protein